MTEELKQHFCDNLNLPIGILEEPYFTNRLKIFDSLSDYTNFNSILQNKFKGSEQDYLKSYNDLAEQIASFLQFSEAFAKMKSSNEKFIKIDFKVNNTTIFTEDNIGKKYIRIYMPNYEYRSLVVYSKLKRVGFESNANYYDFISRFTDIEMVRKSSKFKKMIFDKCMPEAQVCYATFVINQVLNKVVEIVKLSRGIMYSTELNEVFIEVTPLTGENVKKLYKLIEGMCNSLMLCCDYIQVGYEKYTKSFIMCKHKGDFSTFECTKENTTVMATDPIDRVLIQRALTGAKITDEDKTFKINGKLARLVGNIDIKFILSK